MAVQEPFVRWLYVKHPPKFCRTGGFFYVETGGGDRIIVAAAVDNGANHLYFRASSTFVAYYRGILPLGNVIRWDFRKDVVAWLDSVVYHSFVRYSGQHIGRCWYVLDAPGPEFTGPTRMPLGLAQAFQGQGVGKWIVPFVDGSLDSVILGQFLVALELDVFDRVFVAVSPTLELQVIVFENDGAERIYEWVVYPSLA